EHLYYSPSARTIYTGARFYKENKYLYDYQLIRKDGDIQEKRILLEQNGKKRYHPDAKLKTQWKDLAQREGFQHPQDRMGSIIHGEYHRHYGSR
ncbi:MAG: hypothetical protein OEW18_08950, partial [Candidatus Aminicenantes bacterium]|nr:hypothetical protein [Candidatus Aminicenantes bacterium]